MRDRKVTVEINISDLVPVISNDGGYLSRECSMCGALGYERSSDYGYRHGTPLGPDHMGNDITHKPKCALNQYIDPKTGKLLLTGKLL